MISIQHLYKSYGATAPAKRGKRPADGGADLSYAASVSGNPALVVAAATQATAQAAHGAAEAAGRAVGAASGAPALGSVPFRLACIQNYGIACTDELCLAICGHSAYSNECFVGSCRQFAMPGTAIAGMVHVRRHEDSPSW